MGLIRTATAALLASLGLLGLEPAGAARPSDVPVPILMYHVLAEPPANAPYPDPYGSPKDFHAQLRWLDRHDYTAVTLHDVWDRWHGRGRLPAQP